MPGTEKGTQYGYYHHHLQERLVSLASLRVYVCVCVYVMYLPG